MRRRSAEEKASNPSVRLDVLRERRKALEAERDAACGGILAALDEPWDRRLACLKYEEDIIWHEHGDCDAKHPGKPPEGYEPQTLGQQASAQHPHSR